MYNIPTNKLTELLVERLGNPNKIEYDGDLLLIWNKNIQDLTYKIAYTLVEKTHRVQVLRKENGPREKLISTESIDLKESATIDQKDAFNEFCEQVKEMPVIKSFLSADEKDELLEQIQNVIYTMGVLQDLGYPNEAMYKDSTLIYVFDDCIKVKQLTSENNTALEKLDKFAARFETKVKSDCEVTEIVPVEYELVFNNTYALKQGFTDFPETGKAKNFYNETFNKLEANFELT